MSKMRAELQDNEGNKAVITLENLHERLLDLENIKVKNGTEKIMSATEIMAEVWESTEVLRDINKLWKVLKKYKWFFVFMAGSLGYTIFKWEWLLKALNLL